MKIKKYIIVISLFSIFSSHQLCAINSNSIIVDEIEYYFQTDKSFYNWGEEVELTYRITNMKDEMWSIMGLFPITDVIVLEKEGGNYNEIWNLTWYMTHPTGPVILELEPMESFLLEGIWPQINLNRSLDPADHTQVPPGYYRISGECYPTDTCVFLDVEIIPEPCSSVLFLFGLAIFHKLKWGERKNEVLRNTRKPETI